MIQAFYDYLGVTDPSWYAEVVVMVASVLLIAFGALVVLNVVINIIYSVIYFNDGGSIK